MTTTAELTEHWKPIFDRRASKHEGVTFAGIEYDWQLAGPGGAEYVLFPTKDTPQEQLDKAKEECQAAHDVVGPIRVVRIPQEWLDAESWQPSDSPSGWIDAARWIVKHKAARRVDAETGQLVPENRRGGTLLDLFSASGMVQVHDALSGENRKKFGDMKLPVAHHVAFKLINKCAK